MIRSSVAAAILAGGRARRLGGVVKSTLVLDRPWPGHDAHGPLSGQREYPPSGRTGHASDPPRKFRSGPGMRIIDWQLAALVDVAEPVFVVAPDPAPFAALGLEVTPDIFPGLGALGGIYTAIVRSPHARTLVVAGDLPFLPRALLERLVSPTEADVVVPVGARGPEPLCAVYSRACAEPIRRRLESGFLRASIMPEEVRVEEVGPEVVAALDPGGLLFVNVNTPHDYERARDRAESMPRRRGDAITDE